MTTQPAPEDLAALIALSTENTVPHEGDRHYMSVTLAGGMLAVNFECRHAPLALSWNRCTGEIADEYGLDFLEWYAGAEDNAPLRIGLIDIWYNQGSGSLDNDDDGEIFWDYVAFTRPARATTVTTAPRAHVPADPKFVPTTEALRKLWMKRMPYSNVPEKIESEVGFEEWLAATRGSGAPLVRAHMEIDEGTFTTTITVDSEQLPPVEVFHANESSRMLAIGQSEIERSEGVNVEFFDERYFEVQLVEALAALRFLRANPVVR